MPRPPKDPERVEPRYDEVTQAQVRVPPMVTVHENARAPLTNWLTESVRKAISRRADQLADADDWKKTLKGERPEAPKRAGVSNISVPLTMWARTAVRARLVRSILDAKPIFSLDPYKSRTTDGANLVTAGRGMADVLESDFRNARGLDGRNAVESVVTEIVDFGTGVLKVVPERDNVRKVLQPFAEPDADGNPPAPEEVTIPGRIRWAFISIFDTLWWDGYGVDTNAMPFIGHESDMTWGEINSLASLGFYDREQVNKVKAHYAPQTDRTRPQPTSVISDNRPAELRIHRIAELYLDYDVDLDGKLESIVIDWHVDADEILRVNWNPFPSGRRPILASQFDIPGENTAFLGIGVAQKLQGVQAEVDTIHNIGLEAGKRGVAHIIALKEGSGADEDLGGDTEIVAGDTTITDDPSEDIKAIALGDARGAEVAIQLEEHARVYVTRLLGLDESTIGNVESGKRVPASLGLSTQREGRVIIINATENVNNMLEEAAYLTIDLYKFFLPAHALAAALDTETAAIVEASIFSLSDQSVRSQFILTVNAQDAASAQDTRKTEILTINQFLLGLYDRLLQTIMMVTNPQVPPAAVKPILLVLERMERATEALLNTMESIPNPNELLIKVGELTRLLEESVPTAATAALPAPGPTAGGNGAPGALTTAEPPAPGADVSLGAGVT